MAEPPYIQQAIVTTTGASDAIPIDLSRFSKGVGLIATLSEGGNALYDVEVSGDPLNLAGVDGCTNWNPHDLMQSLSASANGNLEFPCSAVRLNVSGLTGTLTLSVVQAG